MRHTEGFTDLLEQKYSAVLPLLVDLYILIIHQLEVSYWENFVMQAMAPAAVQLHVLFYLLYFFKKLSGCNGGMKKSETTLLLLQSLLYLCVYLALVTLSLYRAEIILAERVERKANQVVTRGQGYGCERMINESIEEEKVGGGDEMDENLGKDVPGTFMQL